MSLKAIDIDPFLLAAMYSRPLVQAAIPLTETDAGQENPIASLGNNGQNVLLLIHNEEAAYLSEQTFSLLTNLLKACRLTLDDVALVNTAHVPGISLYRLSQKFMPHRVIIFGDALPELQANRVKNRAWEEAGCHCLYTDTLQAMEDDKQLKMPFWNALRQFFNLGV